MSLPLKVLYVTTHIPCPPQMGAQQRVLNIGRQLQKCAQVTLAYVGPAVEEKQLEPVRAQFHRVIMMTPQYYSGPNLLKKIHYKLTFHWPFHYGPRFSLPTQSRFQKLDVGISFRTSVSRSTDCPV